MFIMLFDVRRTLKRSTSLRGAAHKGGDVAIPRIFREPLDGGNRNCTRNHVYFTTSCCAAPP